MYYIDNIPVRHIPYVILKIKIRFSTILVTLYTTLLQRNTCYYNMFQIRRVCHNFKQEINFTKHLHRIQAQLNTSS